MNQTFEELAHFRPKEWLGKTDFDFWPKEQEAQNFWDWMQRY